MLKTKVTTPSPQIKRRVIGGPTARGIYGHDGLASRLRKAREHNTMDRTYGIGRPPMNDDGTRTYMLVEPPPREPVHLEGHCDRCCCPDATAGEFVVDGHLVTCHCDCHDDKVVYHGERRSTRRRGTHDHQRRRHAYTVITRDGKSVQCREDVRRLAHSRDWGPRSTRSTRERLALDLCIDLLDDIERSLAIYERLAEELFAKLTSGDWTISARELRRLVEILEASVEVTQ